MDPGPTLTVILSNFSWKIPWPNVWQVIATRLDNKKQVKKRTCTILEGENQEDVKPPQDGPRV